MVTGCQWLRDVSVICYVVNPLWTSKQIWRGFLYKCTVQGNDSELTPMVKMETRNPIEGYYGGQFPAICNHCIVMAECNSKMLKHFGNFLRLFEKKAPVWLKCQNSVLKVFITTPADMLCSNFVKFGQREISEIVHCLPDKKNLPGSPAVPMAQIVPKTSPSQPQTTYYSDCFRFHPNWFTLG